MQLGGPINKDKLFFFGSVQRYAIRARPDRPRTIRTEVSPRFNVKLTCQPTPNDNFTASLQYDQYNQKGRTALDSRRTPRLTQPDGQPGLAGDICNAQYRKVFGSSTFLEAKFTG